MSKTIERALVAEKKKLERQKKIVHQTQNFVEALQKLLADEGKN